jgi:hypothetical protein
MLLQLQLDSRDGVLAVLDGELDTFSTQVYAVWSCELAFSEILVTGFPPLVAVGLACPEFLLGFAIQLLVTAGIWTCSVTTPLFTVVNTEVPVAILCTVEIFTFPVLSIALVKRHVLT